MTPTPGTGAGLATVHQLTEGQHDIVVHPSAVIHPSATLSSGCKVGPFVTIGERVCIEANSQIGAGTYIGDDTVIGSDTYIGTRVVIRNNTKIGSRCRIRDSAVIGCDGFGYAQSENGLPYKIPQIGHVEIGDDVFVGTLSTIDRATLGKTVIADGAHVGCLTQIGHNANVGQKSEIGDRVGICGSCKLEDEVNVGDSSGLVGHIRIGKGSVIATGSGVTKDLKPKSSVAGMIAMDVERWQERRAIIERLPQIWERVRKLGIQDEMLEAE